MTYFSEEMTEAMIRRYNEGATYLDLSFEFPANHATIRKHLKDKVKPHTNKGRKWPSPIDGKPSKTHYLNPQARIARPSQAKRFR
jgi:hypothetical protein